jgi:hypothetical protein
VKNAFGNWVIGLCVIVAALGVGEVIFSLLPYLRTTMVLWAIGVVAVPWGLGSVIEWVVEKYQRRPSNNMR